VKLTGTWHGEYTYGPGYGTALAGTSVPFVMSLTESWLRKFAGYVRDDASKGGQPERGRIAGMRQDRVITFVKTMPTSYVSDEQGRKVEKRAWLRTMFGLENPELSPHRIHYQGTWSPDGQHVSGTWSIRSEVVGEDGDGVHMVGGEGTWTARRVADLPSEV